MLPYIEIFGHQIAMYAVCIMAGLVLGIITALLRAAKYPCKGEDVLYASFYGILGLVAGGKLLYLATLAPFLIRNFSEIMNRETIQALMSGGFVFYGGILGALAGIWIYTRQYHLKTLDFVEVIIPSVPLIHAFGRVGCFCAGCCYGIRWEGTLSVTFQNALAAPNGMPLFPVQLAEALGNFIIFILLMTLFRKQKTCGQLTSIYFIAYSMMRFGLEYLRADTARGIWLGMATSQWISIIILIAGIVTGKKSIKNKRAALLK